MSMDPAMMCELLVGLKNVDIISVTEVDNDLLIVEIETKYQKTYCQSCSSVAKIKDRTVSTLIDSMSFGRKVKIKWVKRRFYCDNDKCEVKTWTEENTSIAFSRLLLTDRAARYVTKQVGQYGRPVSDLAKELGCSWHTINDAVVTYGRALVEDPLRYGQVEALGIDEVLFLRDGEYKKLNFSTQITDVKAGQLIDVVPGKGSYAPIKWLTSRDQKWKDAIEYGTLDLSSPFKSVFDKVLPEVTLIADPFHVVKLANSKLDECRRRVQNEVIGHRGRKTDPLYRCRKLLLKANEKITVNGKDKLMGLLEAGDPHGEVVTTWQAKEAVRELYSHANVETASQWIDELVKSMSANNMPIEVKSLAKTLIRWKEQIISWHKAHLSNATTEGINNFIKRIKRTAFGFRNFDHYRIRSLLYAGKPNWSLLATVEPR